jgi:hypothetical protein
MSADGTLANRCPMQRLRTSASGARAILADFTGLKNGFLGSTNVSNGSWLRDNALTQSATAHDPVNVVRHGRFEQFFPVGRSGAASESSWGMLGKVLLEIGTQSGLYAHALIAAINAVVPTIFMTRVRL